MCVRNRAVQIASAIYLSDIHFPPMLSLIVKPVVIRAATLQCALPCCSLKGI